MVCGLPGSGKSTVARRLERELGLVRLTPDEWILRLGGDPYDPELRDAVEALQWGLAQRLLAIGSGVVMESGFWSRSERDAVRHRAAELGAAVELHFLDVPLEELKARLRERNEDPATSIHVDPEMLDEWVRSFEPPDPEELETVEREMTATDG
jgi:predicted kinase